MTTGGFVSSLSGGIPQVAAGAALSFSILVYTVLNDSRLAAWRQAKSEKRRRRSEEIRSVTTTIGWAQPPRLSDRMNSSTTSLITVVDESPRIRAV